MLLRFLCYPDMSHTLSLCWVLAYGACSMSQLQAHLALSAEVESYQTGRVSVCPWLRFCIGRLINSQNASRARKGICLSGSVRSIIHLEASKRGQRSSNLDFYRGNTIQLLWYWALQSLCPVDVSSLNRKDDCVSTWYSAQLNPIWMHSYNYTQPQNRLT